MGRQGGHHRSLDLGATQRIALDTSNFALEANTRRRPWHKQQVASAAGNKRGKPTIQP